MSSTKGPTGIFCIAPKRFVLWLILCCSIHKLPAQDLSQLKFEVYDEENGLSSNWIEDIVLDSTGYLWLGTQDGLNRFDGHSFKVFKHQDKDPKSLLHDNGQKIYLDRNGVMWISYAEGGFSTYNKDGQCFTHINSAPTKIIHGPDRVFGIKLIDKNNNLWFSGDGLGLNKYNPKSNTFEQYDLPGITEKFSETDKHENNTVYCIYEDQNGLLWLGTQNGLYTFDLKNHEFSYKKHSSPLNGGKRIDNYNKIVPEGQNGFWLGSWNGGIHYFDIKTGAFTNYLFETKKYGFYNLVYDIVPKNENEFWIASGDRGLGVFNKKTKELQFNSQYKKRNKEHLLFLNQIVKAPNGTLFLADEDALLKYSPTSELFQFNYLPIASSQHGNIFLIRKIIENPNESEIYFLTYAGNGLNVLNTKTNKMVEIPMKVNHKRDPRKLLYTMLEDQQQKRWLVSRDFLFEFDAKNKKLMEVKSPFKFAINEPDIEFKNAIQNHKQHIVILTNNGGLYEFNTLEKKLQKKINSGNSKLSTIDNADFATFDLKDRLWLTGNNKIGFYTKDFQQVVILKDAKLQEYFQDGIRDMTSDEKGNVWVSFRNIGLLKINASENNQFNYKLYTTADGLPTNRLMYLCVDQKNNLWISCFKGAILMNTTSNTFKLYNQTVGMDKYTLAMRFCQAGSDAFYITVPGNYCKVNYDNLSRKVSLPKVYIDQFKVLNQIRTIDWKNQTATVNPGEDFFSFDFSCIDFTNQANHNFAYKLEGWDKDWIQCGNRRFAGYTNLNGGNYVFMVKAANSEGVWGEPVTLKVNIQIPFYRNRWFLILVAVLIAFIVYILYRFRISQIEKSEKQKTDFNKKLVESRMAALRAQMNPHFIFNSLNSINRYIVKSDAKTSSLYLTRFAKLIRLILDNSENKTVTLAHELEALELYIELEQLRFDNKFTFAIQMDEKADLENLEVPPLILQPYVENAIWHGLMHKETGGNLNIKISRNGDFILCEIEDNGIGREKAKEYKNNLKTTHKSMGMKLTEERLKLAESEQEKMGTHEITDILNEKNEICGTRVFLKIPIE